MHAILTPDKQVARLIETDEPFTHNNIQYPGQWFALSSRDEQRAAGVVPVVSTIAPDDRYFVVAWDAPYWDDLAQVVRREHHATPRPLALIADEKMAVLNAQAREMLSKSDWRVIRQSEDANLYPLPPDLAAWRRAIRAEVNRVETAMRQATSLEALLAAEVSLLWPAAPDSAEI